MKRCIKLEDDDKRTLKNCKGIEITDTYDDLDKEYQKTMNY